MKAIIPVAGAGVKLRPHTYTQPKPLMPVAGKPVLGFIIEQLVHAGFDDFIFVIGYLGEKIESYVKKNYPQIQAQFVIQNMREGLGHAIWLAKDLIGKDEEIFIALGDTIFEVDLKAVIDAPHSSIGVKKVDDPRSFGVVQFSSEDCIAKVIEKPEIPKSNMAMVGLYKIKESGLLMDALEEHIKKGQKTQGEYQLTDGLMELINQGVKIKSFPVNNWYDCGKKEILLETNATLLKKNGFDSEKMPAFDNTIIVRPVSIAKSCKISNSIIGPNVTIGENTCVSHSIIKDSIIGTYSDLEDVVLNESVVGSDSKLKGAGHSLNIGDNTEIDLL